MRKIENVSDLYLLLNASQPMRINGKFIPFGEKLLEKEDMKRTVLEILSERKKETLLPQEDLDFSYASGIGK